MAYTTVREVLKAAKLVVADIDHWIQGSMAEDNCGVMLRPDDPDATCFCSLGACCRVQGVRDLMDDFYAERAVMELDKAALALFGAPLGPNWSMAAQANDGELDSLIDLDYADQHAAVLKMFDRAIAFAE